MTCHMIHSCPQCYATAIDASNIMRDGASENINARLTSLENFVGNSYQDNVGENYPNVSIAGKEMLATIKTHAEHIEQVVIELASNTSTIQDIEAKQNANKHLRFESQW
eukprot:10666161-Ditylum_brightwellii.AAC.1